MTKRGATDTALAEPLGRNSDALLRRLVESSMDGILAFDLDCRYTIWNPAMERISGMPREKALGQCAFELFPFLVETGEDRFFHDALQGKTVSSAERAFRVAESGKEGWFEGHYSPLHDDHGRVIGGLAIIRDVTERKRTLERSQALELQRQSFRVFESITDAFFGLDLEWRFTYVNETAERLLQRPRSELLGRSIWEAFPEAIGTTFHEEYHKARATNLTTRFEAFYPPLSAWFEVKAFPSPDGLAVYFHDVSARHVAEAELRKSEERWHLAVEATNDGIWDWNIQTDALYWSPRCKVMLGYTDRDLPEVTRQTYRDLVHPDDSAPAQQAYENHLDGSTPTFTFEYRLRHRDGQYRWVLSRGIAVRNDAGVPVRMVGSHTDVTERKRTEAELRRSAGRLSLALAAANLGDWQWDPTTDLMTFSDRVAEIYGVPPGAAASRTLLRERLHPEDRENARIANERAAETGEVYDIEYRVLRANGSVRWIAAKGRGQYDETGRLVEMLGVVQDITDRKNAEAALIESEARHRSFFELISVGLVHAEWGTGRFLNVNAKLSEITGYSQAELLSMRFFELTHPQDRALDMETYSALVRGEISTYELEKRLLRKDGSTVWVHVNVTAMFDASGRPTRTAAIVQDVSDRRRAEADRDRLLAAERSLREEAERSSRLKDEFLATVSHELRTPLNAMLGYAQLLQRFASATGDIADGLAIIERNGRVQAQIISDMLDMSRIVSGKLSLAIQPIALHGVVNDALESIQASAETKGVRITSVFSEREETVLADPARLQQIVWNLLTNAVKFTPSSGEVRVTVGSEGELGTITISDSGQGIDPAFLPHVFEKFRQADASSSRRHGGLGLGLAIVKHLTELQGGSVAAASEGLGKGATFIASFPLARRLADSDGAIPRPEPKRTTGERTEPLLEGLSVLVVDDQPDARTLAQRFLAEWGASVVTAASAEEALARLDTAKIDVVVSDIGMPGTDGYELIRRLRARGDSTPAVALTAFARAQDCDAALQAGFQAHIAKPVDPVELISTVTLLARDRRERRE